MAAADARPLGQAIEAFVALDAPPDEERDAAHPPVVPRSQHRLHLAGRLRPSTSLPAPNLT